MSVEVLWSIEAPMVAEWRLPKQEKHSLQQELMHHNLTTGTQLLSLSISQGSVSLNIWDLGYSNGCWMSFSEPHSPTQNQKKTHFFQVIGMFWS